MSSILGLSSSASSSNNIAGPSSPRVTSTLEVPDLVLEILVEAVNMTHQQALVLTDQKGHRTKVDDAPNLNADVSPTTPLPINRKKTRVVLERWRLSFEPSIPHPPPELPLVYKKCIILFRTLYTLLRTLPSWSLFRRLSRRSGIRISSRLVDSRSPEPLSTDEVPLEASILPEEERSGPSETFEFGSILTPLGALTLQCSYRLNVDFAVEDLEAIATSRFIEEDMFKPTVARFRQAGSLPTGKSPPIEKEKERKQTYGSLSSRHLLANARDSSHPSTSPTEIQRPSAPVPSQRPPIPVPLMDKSKPLGVTPPGSISSGSNRYGSYGDVEPAFVASRTRTQSLGLGSSGRDAVAPLPLRQRQTSTSGGRMNAVGSPSTSANSPLFRPGSFIGARHSSSASPGSASPSTTSSVNRPISSLFPQPARAGSVPSPRPIAGSVPGRRYSSGKYAQSYGQGSSLGSNEPFPTDNSPSRSSWDAGQAAEGSSTTSVGSNLPLPLPVTDADDINSFLSLIDSRPQLMAKSARRSRVISKSQADEALRRIQGNMISSLSADQGFAAAASVPVPGPSRRSKLSMEGGRAEVVVEEEEEAERERERERERTNSPESPRFRSRPVTLSSRNNSFSSMRGTPFPSYGSSNSLRRLAGGEGGSSSIEDGPIGRLELRDEFDATGSGDESDRSRRWNLRRPSGL
ncbi:hypothetical protein BT69DRAFT_724041 [Atractiella rhizophila]|nr:hypothetical protein BT69DRAFT_724041 [Atractiella rhizophila]